MHVLLTGASGFLGSAVLRRLLDEGYSVRALLRPGSDRSNVHGLPVEQVDGDLKDTVSLKNAVRGCDALFHVAADYRLWVPDPASIYQINVEGTKNLILSAVEAGVKKIVYTSSVATLGLNKDGTPANEDTPVSVDDMTGHYKRSKFLAEQAVSELVETVNAPVVIVNPSAPVGPRDIKPTPTGRIFVDALNNRMPAYVETGLNIVHVDDVAAGHILAFKHGIAGERYILGGENMTLKTLLELISEIGNVRAPGLRIPHNLLLPIAITSEWVSRITGKTPFITVDEIMMAKKLMYFSSDKAKTTLGYSPGPVRNAIEDAIIWFRNHGYCRQ